jgi:hypothetical protein
MEKDAMNSAQVQHAIRRADANCAMVQKYRVLQRLQVRVGGIFSIQFRLISPL